jgi:hypothetical protein
MYVIAIKIVALKTKENILCAAVDFFPSQAKIRSSIDFFQAKRIGKVCTRFRHQATGDRCCHRAIDRPAHDATAILRERSSLRSICSCGRDDGPVLHGTSSPAFPVGLYFLARKPPTAPARFRTIQDFPKDPPGSDRL